MTQEAQDPQAEAPAVEQEEAFCIETVDQFGQLVTVWHKQAMATLLHLTKVPVGQMIKIGDEEPFALEGDILKGFNLGLQLALNYVGKLPFEATIEEIDTADAANQD